MIKCLTCEKEFQPTRKNNIYCEPACRYRAAQLTRPPDLAEKRKERMKKWGSDNFERKRAYMLKYTYGITTEQYNELLVKQNYSCAVCKRHESEFKIRLAVEHHHGTGEIQGLCCSHCNRNIIGRNRNPELFYNAAEYLTQSGTGWFVPPKPKKKRRKKSPKSI